MLVRCGRCRVELEVAGAGEFACPNCGARNAVRGPAGPTTDPLGLPDLGGLGAPRPPDAPPPAEDTDIRWVSCPSCAYRFAVGEVEHVGCPSCGTELMLGEDGIKVSTE